MVTNADESPTPDIQKLAELIKDIRMAMLTTAEADGSLRSRPMATQTQPFDGTLWFFTANDSGKVHEIAGERHVNISYADPKNQKYVSVSGIATVLQDRQKAEQLWNPMYKAWFPKGLDDPTLALLKVQVNEAEFWEAPPGAVVRMAGFLKAITTGQRYDAGDHRRMNLANGSVVSAQPPQ